MSNLKRATANFINILQAAFAPIFFRQKSQCQTVIREKLRKPQSTFVQKVSSKMLMKLTPDGAVVDDATDS